MTGPSGPIEALLPPLSGIVCFTQDALCCVSDTKWHYLVTHGYTSNMSPVLSIIKSRYMGDPDQVFPVSVLSDFSSLWARTRIPCIVQWPQSTFLFSAPLFSQTNGAEKRTNGEEKRTNGAEKRTNGAEKRTKRGKRREQMVQRREQMVQRREQMVQRREQMVQRREQMVQRRESVLWGHRSIDIVEVKS